MGHSVDVLTTAKDEIDLDTYEDFTVYEVKASGFFNFLRFFYRKTVKESTSSAASASSASSKKGIIKRIFGWFKSRGLSTSTRMPDALDLWVGPASRWAIGHGKKWDVVVSTFGPYACHLIASKVIARRLGTFWVADFRDTWTDSPYYRGIPPFTYLEAVLENDLVHGADLVTIVSEALAVEMRTRFPTQKIFALENGCDHEEIENLLDNNAYGNDFTFRFLYTGSLYPGIRDPSFLFSVLAELERDRGKLENLTFLFAGPNGDYVLELAKQYGVSHLVENLGQMGRDESLRSQRDSDALLFFESVESTLTGKLFEYLFSGTPILSFGISDQSSAGSIIVETGTGINFLSDRDKTKKALMEIEESKRIAFYHPNSAEVKKYSRQGLAEKFMTLIQTHSQKLPSTD
jgi:glycosyltransferase involved in cell wall biosynthesis